MIREQKSRRRRLVTGLCGAILLTQVARTMAEDLLPPDPAPIEAPVETPAASASPEVVPTQSPEPVPTQSPTPQASVAPASVQTAAAVADPVPTSTASSTPSPSPSPTPIPPHAVADQNLVIQLPKRMSVDPRARTIQLPQLVVYGSPYILACLNSSQIIFALSHPDTAANSSTANVLVAGSGTTNVRISGSPWQVMSVLNSVNGMRLNSAGTALANHGAAFAFIAVSEPTIKPALCGDFAVSNYRTLYFQPLGLNIDMVNGNVTLKH